MTPTGTSATRWISLLLVLTSLAVYCQVGTFEFVNYDDEWIITENPYIRDGLTRDAIVWAFTDSKFDWWHPLTWLSHMLDIELFGMSAGMHHLTNVWFHVANTLLLFAVLKRMTGATWRSGIVAALFALHPLHVESVAWVTERKDVLSTLFWLLTMLAYCRYVEKPTGSRYAVILAAFVCGLMSKPMLVTLPFVLLLLDWWPLKRLGAVPILRLIMEKLPLLVLAIISSVLTVIGQQQVSGVPDTTAYPLWPRLGNALISYVVYLRKMVWPTDLAVFYPFPTSLPLWQVGGALVLLLAVTIWVFWLRRKQPWLGVGWLWYLGTLLPVIGLIQVGDRAMADRFTYVPLIGIFVMCAWGLPAVAGDRRVALITATVATMVACMVTTWFQIRTWQNSVTLFEHAARVVPGSYVAHNNLGVALALRGQRERAMRQFEAALRFQPRYAPALANLGRSLEFKGHTDDAITLYATAIESDPSYVQAHYNLGAALLQKGEIKAAVKHLSEAVRLKPYFAAAQYHLAVAFARQGRTSDAMDGYAKALRLKPDYADAHYDLALALARQGKNADAIPHYFEAVRLNPGNPRAHYNFGVALATEQRFAEAIAQYQEAIRIKLEYPEAHNNLGLAFASVGRTKEAIAAYREAIRLKPDYAKAHLNLGMILFSNGRAMEAQESFRQAAKHDSSLNVVIQSFLQENPMSLGGRTDVTP
jgi:tetratricopeptide (TPR) repeat protein